MVQLVICILHSFYVMKTLVPLTQLVNMQELVRHRMHTHIQSTAHPLYTTTGCSVSASLTAAGCKPSGRTRHSSEQENQQGLDPHLLADCGGRLQLLPTTGMPGVCPLLQTPPTEGQALCQEMWRPAFLCHPGFQDPASKMSLSGLHGNFTTITQTSTQALCFTSIFAPHSVLSRQRVTQETRTVMQAQT